MVRALKDAQLTLHFFNDQHVIRSCHAVNRLWKQTNTILLIQITKNETQAKVDEFCRDGQTVAVIYIHLRAELL